MPDMYAKLFSRITESSLMEEPINIRYTFVMMLAICDPTGHVIGTDVAIARRINMPLPEFKECAAVLLAPDTHSNSQEEDGRRLIPSDGERGYKVVNYLVYREMRDETQRREYMRDYMQKYRERNHPVKRVNKRKRALAKAEAEAHSQADSEEETKADFARMALSIYDAYPRKVAKLKAIEAIQKAQVLIPSKELLKRTLAYAEARKGHDDQFTPHAATWFNQARYDDPPESWATSTGNGHLSKGAAMKAERSIGLFPESINPPTSVYTDES